MIVILHALRVWEPTRVAAAASAATLSRLAVSAATAFWVGSHKTATSNRTHRDQVDSATGTPDVSHKTANSYSKITHKIET